MDTRNTNDLPDIYIQISSTLLTIPTRAIQKKVLNEAYITLPFGPGCKNSYFASRTLYVPKLCQRKSMDTFACREFYAESHKSCRCVPQW